MYLSNLLLYIELQAYLLTEEVPPRELDGPSASLALGDIISNVMPPDGKKDKLGSDGSVSVTIILFRYIIEIFNI